MKIDIYKGFKKGDFALINGELVKISHFVVTFDSIKTEYATVHFRYLKDTNRYIFNTDYSFLKTLDQKAPSVLYG